MQGKPTLACQIMDLSEQAQFVFYKDDFRIAYANKKARELFGENVQECTCYEAVMAKQLPCMDCPFVVPKNVVDYEEERYLKIFDQKTRVKAKELTWEDGRQAILCKLCGTEKLFEAKYQSALLDGEQFAEKLRLSGELYETVVGQLRTIVFEYNYRQHTSYVSALFQEKFGIEKIEDINFLSNAATAALVEPEDREIYQMLFGNRENDFREVTCRLREKNGNSVWYRICIQFIYDEVGNPIRAIGTLKDVDEVTRSHAELRYRSQFDTLTNIPNVNRFYIDVGNLLMEKRAEKFAVISFDIDKFKMINDLFGMITGDDVLRHIASVLKDTLPEDAFYCRVHSDVFYICVRYEQRGDLIKLIEKLRKGIFRNEFAFDINTSFGIYLVTDTTIPVNLMCDRASLAARTVKDSAMNFCAFYDEQYRNEIVKTAEIEHDMSRAIADKQFVMYLQPKYDLQSGKICGAEVLSRWLHPVKGMIQPIDFIPLFERNGFILRLDEYMWESACKALAEWREQGITPVPLSVNISRYHIKNNDLVTVWKRLIGKYRIPTSDLTLEITETFFHESEELYNVLKQLRDMGFRLEVDDFGAGYSSLNMIRNIPVDTIKIDKDFLDQKLTTEKGKIVISHTISMAKDLKLNVVAEGVETEEHVNFLKSSSCDVAQGYFFAKPMPLEDFNRLLLEEQK